MRTEGICAVDLGMVMPKTRKPQPHRKWVKLGEMAIVDVDNVCRKCTSNFLSLDMYSLKIAPLKRLLL